MIFDFKKLVKSFGYAIDGLKIVLFQEQTFRIFCFIAVFVIVLMFLLQVSFFEKLILILVITFLMTFELINSRIEEIVDVFQPNNDSKAKTIKDITAGAVLLASLGATIIGILIFLPRLIEILF
jgi:diacylglycerol kinase